MNTVFAAYFYVWTNCLLQAQIGSAPQNTLFVKCVEYTVVGQVLVSIIAGTVAAACVLVVVVLLVYCYARRRCPSRDTQSPISMPLTTFSQLVPPGYRRSLSTICDSGVPSQTRHNPNSRPGVYPPLYENLSDVQDHRRKLEQEYADSNEQYGRRRVITAVRPTSMYPEDQRSPTDGNMIIRRPKICLQNTQSLYANDGY